MYQAAFVFKIEHLVTDEAHDRMQKHDEKKDGYTTTGRIAHDLEIEFAEWLWKKFLKEKYNVDED